MQKRKKWTLWSLEKYRLHLPDADISLKLRVYCMTQQEELENSWYCRNMAGGPLTDEELAKACRSKLTVLAIFFQWIYKETDSGYLPKEKIVVSSNTGAQILPLRTSFSSKPCWELRCAFSQKSVQCGKKSRIWIRCLQVFSYASSSTPHPCQRAEFRTSVASRLSSLFLGPQGFFAFLHWRAWHATPQEASLPWNVSLEKFPHLL